MSAEKTSPSDRHVGPVLLVSAGWGRAQHTMVVAIPGQVAMGYMRKQAEQASQHCSSLALSSLLP